MIRKTLTLILIGYFILVGYWMLYGFGRSAGSVFMYNLEPFATIKHFIEYDKFNKNVWLINIVGNMGLFIPFGLLIPVSIRFLYIRSLVVFLIGLAVLEVAQLLTKRGSFDVDDFILNSIGFSMGYIIFKLIDKLKKDGFTRV